MTAAEFNDILLQKKIETHDEDNIFPPEISDREGMKILIHHFLGDHWYVNYNPSPGQVNSEAIMQILSMYPNTQQEKEKRKKKVADFFHNIIDSIFG